MSTPTYTLDKVRQLFLGMGATPVYFGDSDHTATCYGRTAAAGLVTIHFIGQVWISVGTTTWTLTHGDTLQQLVDRHVPTRAKLEAAEIAQMAPRKSRPVHHY